MSERAHPAVCDPKVLDAIFTPYDQGRLPGAVVGVAIQGRPVYRRGFGLANMDLPVLLTPATRMRIGSTTKHFVALAYLLLCEDGLASADAQIGQYVPRLHPANAGATMRALMGHTSGLRDVFQASMFMHGIGRTITDVQLLEYYEHIDDRDFPAGTGWSYNNGGYLLLTAAIERIAGQRLEEVLEQRIFAPLGLYDTQLRRWDSDFLSNSAALHMFHPNQGYTRVTSGMELTGAGGIVSSMDDMLRWLHHMDAPVIGSPATWRELRSPGRLADGTTTRYGFGLVSDRYRGIATLSHAGGVFGGNSQMIKVPAAGLDISVAVNRGDANAIDLAFRVIDACVPGLEAAATDAIDSAVCGVYRCARSGRVVELMALGGRASLRVDGGMPMSLCAVGPNAWQLSPMFSFLGQTVCIESGNLLLQEFGAVDVLERLPPASATPLGRQSGRYCCDALAVTAQVLEASGEMRLITTGRFGEARYALTRLAADLWQAQSLDPLCPIGGMLTFAESAAAFTLNSDRMRNVRFRRTG